MGKENKIKTLRHENYPQGKPMQSKLCQYQVEIFELRFEKKLSYRKIVLFLREKYGMKVAESTLRSFIKVRTDRLEMLTELRHFQKVEKYNVAGERKWQTLLKRNLLKRLKYIEKRLKWSL